MTKNLLFAALLVVAGVSVTSCGNDRELEEQTTDQTTAKGKAHVRLVCGMDVGVDQQPMARHATMRATLKANDRELTDLYIMDYDKATGKLLQVPHQTSAAADFAEPDLTLDYGEHVLKEVATRSASPTLLDAASDPWNVAANVLTPVNASQPVALTVKNADLPTGYWQSRQRILCNDDEKGGYYTYVPHGNITQAGYKTAYCIQPIRTELLPQQDGHVEITVDDEWK